MRSITTDERTPVAISMPGRYKSCRRSPSELFTKEQEQELQRCAAEGEDCAKAEQDTAQAKEKASPPQPIEANPPKLTPLRWRSTSMKALNGSHDMASSAQQPAAAEEPSKIQPLSAQISETMRASQVTKRPSQAQLRAQVMNSLSSQSVERANNVHSLSSQSVERANNVHSAREPVSFSSETQHVTVKDGSLNSAKPVELQDTIPETKLLPEIKQEENKVSSVAHDEPVKAPAKRETEKREIASGNGIKGATKKADMPIVPINHDLPEEIVFQPVDLDQKYREKELVRHVTAAKIQNREEALLNNPGSPAINGRKGPVGEEPSTMTIEFLRARLQAERSASKTVKLKMESLSKKVADLESKLLAEVELRKTAEAALHDALSKLKQAVPVPPVPTTSGGQKVADAEGKENVKTVQWGDVGSKAEMVSGYNKTVSRDELPSAANLALKEKKEPEGAKDAVKDGAAAVDGEVVNKGGLWRDRSVSPHPSSGSVPGVGVNGEKESVAKVSQDSSSDSGTERAGSPSNEPTHEKRAVIEERLRSMWAKIGEDMAALAEVRGDGEPGTKDAVGWMAQLPSVLQEKQQSSGDSGGTAVNGQQVDSSEGDSEQTEAGRANGKKQQNPVPNKAAAFAEKRKSNSFKRNSSLAKNVAKLVEQYEFQETAQREWEENMEAQQSHEQNEGEPPALVTPNGDVVTERTRAKEGLTRSQSEESKKTVHRESISRSKSLGFLPSQQGLPAGGKKSQRGTSNGRIEILDESLIEESLGLDDTEELLFDPETEVAEELPNGIYIHHSRAEVDPSYSKRGSPKDAASIYRRGGTERVGASNDIHSPRRHTRDRFPRADSHGDAMDHQQGWPVREVQDRASRDMYYDPVINNRGGVSYSNTEQFHHRSKSIPERIPDDMYRNGPWREDRRAPPTHYSNPSTEEAPAMPYGFTHRDHPDQDVPSYRAAPTYRQSSDGHRSMPAAWQEGGGRGMNHPPYGYPSKGYGVEEPQQTPYMQQGMYGDTGASYRGRDMQFMPHGTHNLRSDYYSSGGISGPGPRPSYVPPDRPPASHGYTIHEDGTAPVGVADEGIAAPGGEAGEVLKALRIAKQQIKSASGEQAAFMTAQYTVSQEHRYSAGGAQVSKTSYTVEAPVGWHLEGGKSSSKRNGTNGLNVTELISGGAPLTAAGGESSYVEKLNVGRGIQFFFSG